jgi:hypothetical protein
MSRPSVTVVVPVYNRQEELRRALGSIAAQTFEDFECIVVDDASTIDVASVVDAQDGRFVYVRNPQNSGATGARRLAMERMRGDVLIGLDSDDEFFPWAVERAVHHFDVRPEVDAVCGMYVFPDGLRGRVTGGERLVGPQDYAEGRTLYCDLVGAFRRNVVTEWLATDARYFRLEFRHWLSLGMQHWQLLVDEPWAKVHVDAPNRASASVDERVYADAALFVEECRPWLGSTPCTPVDSFLGHAWVALRRRGRPEAEVVQAWMRERGLSRRAAVARRVRERVADLLPHRRTWVV